MADALNVRPRMPMMYMNDAIRGTIELMEAPAESITVRSAYNLSGCSFTPKELAENIAKKSPGFKISYNPDFRQNIANSWPKSIDDSVACKDWGWKSKFDIEKIVDEMLQNVNVEMYTSK